MTSLAVHTGQHPQKPQRRTRKGGSSGMRSAIHCCLPRAIDIVGERWSLLILRGALAGISNFEEFRMELGIAKSMLTRRLNKLVEEGILARNPSSDDRRKIEYQLTPKGAALLPTLLALRQWGEQWEDGKESDPVLVDKRDGKPVRPMAVFAWDGRPVGLSDLMWVESNRPREGE